MQRNVITPDLLELLDTGSPGDVDFYCQYARQRGGPVLVLLCGLGRVAIPIAKQGVPVIAIDGDASIIEAAKRKAVEAGAARIMFARSNPAHFVSDSKHPLVIIPNGAFQRLLTLDEQRRALAAVCNAMTLGGRLLLDLPILHLAAIPSEQPVVRQLGPGSQGAAVIQRFRRYDSARQLMQETISCEWLDEAGNLVGKQYGHITERYCTPSELELLLEVCGFKPSFYGSFDRHPFAPGSARLVVEAERVT